MVTEVISPQEVELVAEYRICCRSAPGICRISTSSPLARCKPVILKRPGSAVEEWLMAAEYIMKEGNFQVVLCERDPDIRNGHPKYAGYQRRALGQEVKPPAGDCRPSHAAGRRDLAFPLACAALAGADV